ncbi:Deoxyribonuclease I [Heracleum sosnowskyi]|uniref:Deoxyribonuclease I n=1 Tax=Heracleum sosnowskyi TaxID=360622 RepID=A0AAD8MVR8_9APIA|nr:Deoxyribonuclease I [Heracleum sosnowskyi]
MPGKLNEVMWPRLVARDELQGICQYMECGRVSPTDDLDTEDIFQDTQNTPICDIYVFGFQEVVPLKAANILGTEKSKICMKWNSLIRKTLNKNTCSTQQDFRCLISCGIMGCLGNKGSVSVRFRLHETSFCLGPTLDLPRNILEHERVIILGDLNYRISLPEHKIRELVDKGDWNMLLQNDQLRQETRDGQVFEGWHEGVIRFAPTYKYDLESDSYYGTDDPTKAQKKRAPAWCDRIMWLGEGLKQHSYTRNESKLSDHRPVKAVFTIQVKVLQTDIVSRVFRGV